jgi:hypothetical protein
MKAHARSLLGLAALAACSEPTANPRDQLNLDRPVDVAFACYGGLRITGGGVADPSQPTAVSAMPVEACEIRSRLPPNDVTDPPNVPLGQETIEGQPFLGSVDYYGFILQSVPGTVAIARFPTAHPLSFTGADVTILDSDLLTPGKNGITVGSLPVAIATDAVGCHVITANAGSCDLSIVDVASALRFDPDPIVNRRTVVNAAGVEVRGKPYAMVAQSPTGTIGVECPADPAGLVYVAYPSCHLVAAIDGQGRVVAGIDYSSGTPMIVDGNVTCPDECGGATTMPGPRPVSLDLIHDTTVDRRLLAIGAENRSMITVVDLDMNGMPILITEVPLTGDVGVVDVAVSPQIGIGGACSTPPCDVDDSSSAQFQFVYAVATDGTVRVAEFLGANRECETQVDPRYIHDENDVQNLACVAIGDPLRPRRAGARGPGIELVGDGVPTSVTILRLGSFRDDVRPLDPEVLIGYFAAIASSNGNLFFANVDDDYYGDIENENAPLDVSMALAIPHQLRDGTKERPLLAITQDDDGSQLRLCDTHGPSLLDPNQPITGGARLAENPVRFIDQTFLDGDKANSLPGIRGILCEGSDETLAVSELGFAAPVDVRESAYPDLRALRSAEDWTLSWEGIQSGDDSGTDTDGPPIRSGVVVVDGTGMRMVDPSAPFCHLGVEDYDLVNMTGCDPAVGDADCPLGYGCYVHPDSPVRNGSCLPEQDINFLSEPCRRFLISTRRYTVTESSSNRLRLAERARVLHTTPIDGCTSDQQCVDLATHAARLASPFHPFEDQTAAEDRQWVCRSDASRKGPIDRCLIGCTVDTEASDCPDGTVCGSAGVCVEGIVPPLQCVSGTQRYETRVGDAFAVVGTRSGYLHPVIEGAGGRCVVDPMANPLLVGRLPLNPPACTGDALTDLLPNPCLTMVEHTESKPIYLPGTCDPADPGSELVTRLAPAVRFRNPGMTFHLVDPTFAGDATCIGDRAGTLVGIPSVFPGMTLGFTQIAGFTAQVGRINATFPVQVLRGPQGSIWVVDEGDFLSQSNTTASTRGRVFRIEGIALGTINTLQ